MTKFARPPIVARPSCPGCGLPADLIALALTAMSLVACRGGGQMRAEAVPSVKATAPPPEFQALGSCWGYGLVGAQVVGPGPQGPQLYASYLYSGGALELLAVDPHTGETRILPNPAPTEEGARAMVLGEDGIIYAGTLPHAHLLALDTRTQTVRDLGRSSPHATYVWDLALGSDGAIYGATYPEARLVRYSPSSAHIEDLGRMDPIEQYARYVAASPDGFVYVGIGTSVANVAAFEIATGEHREILPPSARVNGQASVFRSDDGAVYAAVGSNQFRLDHWSAIPQGSEQQARRPRSETRLPDGHVLNVNGNVMESTMTGTASSERTFEYPGKKLPIFRLGLGPDHALYASALLPADLFRIDLAGGPVQDLGGAGDGEIYSLLSLGHSLLMGGYATRAPVMTLDPTAPLSASNPKPIPYPGKDDAWRPLAAAQGRDGRAYFGSIAGYGKLDGILAVYDPATGVVTQYTGVAPGQGISSLCALGDELLGGTTIAGGGGSHPTTKEAMVFLWNPLTGAKTSVLVPVPGAAAITDLTEIAPGRAFGIADDTWFILAVVDGSLRVAYQAKLPFSSPVYNAAALDKLGRLWGLARAGIFLLAPNSQQLAIFANAPCAVDAGFAIDEQYLYFGCGSTAYRYRLPSPIAAVRNLQE